MSYQDRPLTKEFVESILKVDCKAGSVIWISPPKYHPRILGLPAGSMRISKHNGKAYCHIKIGSIAYKRADIVFLCATGSWPSMMLDHKDGDSMNDRIDNLREATVFQNAWNHKTRKKESDLPMGVRLTGAGRYSARIGYMKKLITIGTFETSEEASKAYQEKRKELYVLFNN